MTTPDHSLEIDFLASIDLFDGLSDEILAKVLEITQKQTLSPGDKIFEDGDPGDRLFMILEGSVRISKQVPGVGEEALAVLKSGTYFGEMALIDGKPRSADAIANDAATVYSIEAEAFHNLLRSNPDLSYHILMQFVRTLARRLRDTNERIRSFLAFAAFG